MMKSSNQGAGSSGGKQSAHAQSQQAAAHHASASVGGGLEKTIHFSQAQAIVWQIKFILNQITNKKNQPAITQEIENLRGHFGRGFEKYLIRELIEHMDLKDPNRAQTDKGEAFKVQVLNDELAKASLSHTFLQYFGEIVGTHPMGDKVAEFLVELSKRLKLNFRLQLLIALSIHESCKEEIQLDAVKLLKQKLVEYHNSGRPEVLPEYASHRLIYLLSTSPELSSDETLKEKDMVQYLRDTSPLKPGSHLAFRSALSPGMFSSNASTEEPSLSLVREGVGLDNLDKSYRMLEPWQILTEIGHYCTYNYSYLLRVLEDFKDMNELKMAKTLLHLALNHTGTEDQHSRIVYLTLEACKKGDSSSLNQEPNDKVTTMTWSVDNLARAFRELYSNLNWLKVFEALAEVKDQTSLACFDYKAFQVFLALFSKCKPQNINFPLQALLASSWQNTQLHISFIEHSIQYYTTEKKDKSINFQRLERKQEVIDELAGIKDKVPIEQIHVWLSIELVEKLVLLSNSHYFAKVRAIFDYPIKHLPEYLLLTLSLCKPKSGALMVDELLSLLLPQFLGNHINSIPVLQHLWKNNQALIIRGICELCRHDQRIMNLSRVLDITQEVRESLLPIVNCDDYYFAVNLGILAGKRDFLHYDQWLVDRIKTVGTPFIKALLKYMKEHIITPIQEYVRQHSPSNNIADVSPDALDQQKALILERSHLNREKLCITLESLTDLQLRTNPKIKDSSISQIAEFINKVQEYYPNQFVQQPNTEEIDNAANEYFQRVFQAEPTQVDQKIKELLETMLKFKESGVKKEQEIYACMLHSLFDEYRFLHKYPQQYLEKIAKLYGAIIKNKIIDGTLQDIALKFALEAFRREGKRQKFGVITIRQFFDMLPQFPTFFDEIYKCRESVATTDAAMLKDIEELYEKTLKQEEDAKNQAQAQQLQQQTASAARNTSGSAQRQKGESNAAPVQPENNQSERANSKRAPKNQQQQQTKDSSAEFVFQPTNQQEEGKRQASKDEAKSADQKKKPGQPEKPVAALKEPVRQEASGQRNSSSGQSQENKAAKNQSQQQVEIKRPTALEETKAETSQIESGLQPSRAPIFVPINKQKQLQQQPQDNTNFNIKSEEFKINRPAPSSLEPTISVPLPRTIKEFRPNPARQQSPPPLAAGHIPMQVNAQMVEQQISIDQLLQKALNDGSKLRLEELIEDKSLEQPEQEMQSKIIQICNNIGKANFTLKLEELKAILAKDQQVNLKWLSHYILTRRISSNLQTLFINILKALPRDTILLAIKQSLEIFTRCLMIDEEKLVKVVQTGAPGGGSPIKKYLISLGEFVGGLTVANNRPLYARELDVKKMLVEAFFSERLKLVVIFVCRMMKECIKSPIFNKPQNPWIKANLEVLKEIHEQHNISADDISREIESLFYSMNITNLAEVKHQSFLKNIINRTQQYMHSNQQAEYGHIMNKQSLIPPPIAQAYAYLNRLPQASPTASQQPDIQSQVVVPEEFAKHFSWLGENTDSILRSIVAKAVDSSIVEILPPVVDRSVTIALITTRELVLKDFAYDSDPNKILTAANYIVQNLAGSLALVTCKEPLKMSLTTNLKKAIQQLVGETQPESLQMQMTESLIAFISGEASKENLELGCKLINKQVVQKAIAKVQMEPHIIAAIKKRQEASLLNAPGPFLIDESMAQQFNELPPQLKPNPNGLTDQQFQVYEDFQRLNRSQSNGSGSQRRAEQEGRQHSLIQRENSASSAGPASHLSDFEALLLSVDRQNIMEEGTRFKLSEKLSQLTQQTLAGTLDSEATEEVSKLWLFTQKLLLSLSEKFIHSGGDLETVRGNLEALSLIVKGFKGDDFARKLTHAFLKSNEIFPNDLSLTVNLMKHGVILISEWDLQISMHLRDTLQFQQQSDQFLSFLASFIQRAIVQERVFEQSQFPNTLSVVEKLAESPAFAPLLGGAIEALKNKLVWSKEKLKGYILQWASISFEENNQKQEQEVNKFFANLQEIGFYKDSEIMYNFCKVMVEISIERALFTQTGEARPADRLDYRYIESFLKLMVVLLKTSETINKHEFMSKLFEAIQEVLDQDHKAKKSAFNQKPYYRLLINILTAVNNLQIINPKTHQLILFSLADLFSKLNPNKYPCFAFAWLELISHKQFMPHFLAIQNNIPLQQFMSNNFQNKAAAGETSNTFYQKWFKFKELIVNLFSYLKSNMIPGLEMRESLIKYYEATLRTVLVIRHDFPEFLCDFYFHFVNSLPEHCVQLRNIILSANPKSVPYLNPFSKNLKVDNIPQMFHKPRMFSMSYDASQQASGSGEGFPDNSSDAAALNDHQMYLAIMNLREDLESYFRTRNPALIQVICDKLMQSEENINGRRRINSHIINAVVLFIGNLSITKQQPDFKEKECYDMYRRIILGLQASPETRTCFLNCLVNELRYINSQTYFYSYILIHMFSEINEAIQEQITRILIERLQVHEPYPWGLCITFRELLQNPKYNFHRKPFVVQHIEMFDNLFSMRLQQLQPLWLTKRAPEAQIEQQQQYSQQIQQIQQQQLQYQQQ